MTDLEKALAERDFWHRAWHEQRLSTGRAWWEGYRVGQSQPGHAEERGASQGCPDSVSDK